jgi:hypothetical protein
VTSHPGAIGSVAVLVICWVLWFQSKFFRYNQHPF